MAIVPSLQPFLRTTRSVLVLGMVAVAACSDQQAEAPPQNPPPTPVRVASVLMQDVKQTVTLVGSVEPWKRSVVASEVEGIVHAFPAEEGMKVRRGQVLAQLRTRTWRIQLDSALASHREAKTRHRQARRDLNRIRVLYAKELVTQKQYDDALAEENALRERLAQLGAEIRRVRDLLAKSRILAPFDGWITQQFTEVGQWVEEGGAIIEMVDLSHVKVEVPLPERYVHYVRVRNPVTAVFDGLQGFVAQGTVFSVIAQADRVARTFPVKVDIPNPSLAMKSGMVSRVTLPVGDVHKGLVIPKDALVLRDGKEFVFLVNEGTVQQVPVTPVMHFDERIEVKGKLQKGMTVVVEGNERLFPGQPVRILESPVTQS